MVWRSVVVLIEGNGMAWHGVAWPSMVYPVLVAGRWDLDIKGEFEILARSVIICIEGANLPFIIATIFCAKISRSSVISTCMIHSI